MGKPRKRLPKFVKKKARPRDEIVGTVDRRRVVPLPLIPGVTWDVRRKA